MSRVLAAVDDSVAAGPVLTAASALAHLLGSSVDAVQVGESSGTTARESAERAGVPFRLLPGDPLEVLVELAGDDVGAVVVGARSRQAEGTRVGHLAVQLADRLPQPLLVVPPTCAPADRIRRVVAALKGQPAGSRPLHRTMEQVSLADVDLTVVHVDGEEAVPSFADSIAHETEEFAQEYLTRYWPLGPRARLALPVGAPVEELLRVADDVEPDLLAVGWREHAGPGHGRVALELLRRSPYPVLVVPLAG
jgi:nucleotide-binding universal stress UspA family protein